MGRHRRRADDGRRHLRHELPHIPELEASITIGDTEFYYGYFVVLAVMVAVCVGLFRAFKRSGWL